LYTFFYEDWTGYKIIYSFPSNIAYKYQDDAFSIVSQQEIIKRNAI